MRFVRSSEPQFLEVLEKEVPQILGASPMYSALFRDYLHFYLKNTFVEDLSFAAYSDAGELAAYVPLYLCQLNGQMEFSSGGQYLQAPLFVFPQAARRRVDFEREVFAEIERLAKEKKVVCHRAAVEPYEVLTRKSSFNFLRQYGYPDETTAMQCVDLKREREVVWADVRKSYRPLINKTKKKYHTLVVDAQHWDREAGEKYRELHHLAAGRVTRALETFEKMYQMIQKDQAFLIEVLNNAKDLVGAYFFHRFNSYARYASSATHPELESSEGVGHLGLWTAIEYSRDRGDKFFELGWQPFPDESGVTEKLRNIALFKCGFGGEKVSWFRGTRYF